MLGRSVRDTLGRRYDVTSYEDLHIDIWSR
jgi:hypothetical protein